VVRSAEGARHRRFHFTASSPPDSDTRPGLGTAHDRVGRDQESQGTVRLDIQQETQYPHHCVGDRAESAHLASITLCQDPRDALAAMATVQYRDFGSRWDGTGAVATLSHRRELGIAETLGNRQKWRSLSGIRIVVLCSCARPLASELAMRDRIPSPSRSPPLHHTLPRPRPMPLYGPIAGALLAAPLTLSRRTEHSEGDDHGDHS
jgi:hypothetical protein